MISLIALALIVSHPLSAPQIPDAASPAASSETDASRAARDWLALLDRSDWNQSWATAGHAFKSLNTVDAWRWASEKVRVPLGAISSRTFLGEEDLPAPPHGYRVVRFRTTFASKTAIETLSLDREKGGWKVVGITVG